MLVPVIKLFGLQTLIYSTFLHSLCVAEDGTANHIFALSAGSLFRSTNGERRERACKAGQGWGEGTCSFLSASCASYLLVVPVNLTSIRLFQAAAAAVPPCSLFLWGHNFSSARSVFQAGFFWIIPTLSFVSPALALKPTSSSRTLAFSFCLSNYLVNN